MSSPHVLIAGAGISGLTLGQQLRKHNISCTIFERDVNPDARGQGWALSVFGEAMDLIKARMPADLGPLEQTNHLLPLNLPPQFCFYDITQPDSRMGVTVGGPVEAVRANRRRMRDWLMQNLDVRFNKRLIRIDEHDEQVTAYFQDGTSASGDFLVGAEGTRSTVRTYLLGGRDVMKALPLGSIFGETSLSGKDFAKQLSISHSNYIVMDPRLSAELQTATFCALNRVSPDGQTGYYYVILFWVDKDAPTLADGTRWTETATKEQLASFTHERTKSYPGKLRTLLDRIPVEGFHTPGFQLQSVDLEQGQLPAGRVLLIGDAAHSMAPFRAVGANTAIVDAFRLADVLIHIRDEQLSEGLLKEVIAEFNRDLIDRAKTSIHTSNSVLELYAKDAKFVTLGTEASPTPMKEIMLPEVGVVG